MNVQDMINSDAPRLGTVTHLPTPHEVQSRTSRVRHAELLIVQLPSDHDGRNTWLLNYGIGKEAQMLRDQRGIKFNYETQAAFTVGS